MLCEFILFIYSIIFIQVHRISKIQTVLPTRPVMYQQSDLKDKINCTGTVHMLRKENEKKMNKIPSKIQNKKQTCNQSSKLISKLDSGKPEKRLIALELYTCLERKKK